jgi:diketogulonate reductase-like aldo/keto reductase
VDATEIERTVDEAIKAGYRHFDTATGYQNEVGIGKSLQKWMKSGNVSRDELYLVTKVKRRDSENSSGSFVLIEFTSLFYVNSCR